MLRKCCTSFLLLTLCWQLYQAPAVGAMAARRHSSYHCTAPAVLGRPPSKPLACWSNVVLAAGQGAAAWLLPCPSSIAPGKLGADCDAATALLHNTNVCLRIPDTDPLHKTIKVFYRGCWPSCTEGRPSAVPGRCCRCGPRAYPDAMSEKSPPY